LTFVSASVPAAVTGNVITIAIDSIQSGQYQTIDLAFTAPTEIATLVNRVTAFAITADPDATNNQAAATTEVVPVADVTMRKTGPVTADGGSTVTYTLITRNDGPSAAVDVLVTDSLPAGSTFVNASGGGTLAGTAVTWLPITTLAAGDSAIFTVSITAPGTTG
jgi:uncharacterized repeat protein (TIGR01451 family)